MSSVGTYAAGSMASGWMNRGPRQESNPRRTAATSPPRKRFSTNTTTARKRGDSDRPDASRFHSAASCASGLMRYGLPGYVPMQLVAWLPLLPLDRRLCIPLIHADDLADAISRVIDKHAAGPFNLAAEPPVGRDDVANGARRAARAHPVRCARSVSWI